MESEGQLLGAVNGYQCTLGDTLGGIKWTGTEQENLAGCSILVVGSWPLLRHFVKPLRVEGLGVMLEQEGAY